MQTSDKKIVFAGLARDIEPFLPQVRRNIEKYAARFAQWSLVIVENDSKDRTKQLLKDWVNEATANGAHHAALIELDGLAATHPARTDRLAFARNQYLNYIAGCDLGKFDYLAALDMDGPNAFPTSMENFMAAVRFLELLEDAAAVFPNQMPVYYDIWALREKNWCPGDCMQEMERACDEIGPAAAAQKHVFDRQIFIDPTHAPIEVESAFGGIGVYKLPLALKSRYIGLAPDGSEVCEHVAFHRTIAAGGKRFFILPGFLNITNFESTDYGNHHALTLISANGRELKFLAAHGHPFAAMRARFPLYGARFPQLAALYARGNGGSILDIGAGIGEMVALCRLAGCGSHYIAAESRGPSYILLCTNALLHRGLFAGHRLVREFSDLSSLEDGHVGLVKLDANDAVSLLAHNMDYLAEKRSVLWIKASLQDDWTQTIAALSGFYEYIVVFDNFGSVLELGTLDEIKGRLLNLLDDIRHQRSHAASGKVDYLELAFFSAEAQSLYEEFRSAL